MAQLQFSGPNLEILYKWLAIRVWTPRMGAPINLSSSTVKEPKHGLDFLLLVFLVDCWWCCWYHSYSYCFIFSLCVCGKVFILFWFYVLYAYIKWTVCYIDFIIDYMYEVIDLNTLFVHVFYNRVSSLVWLFPLVLVPT